MPAPRPLSPRRPLVALLGALLALLLIPGVATASPEDGTARPRLLAPEEVTFVLGEPGQSYAIETDADPVAAVGVDRLPAGLTLVAHGDGSATLAGVPTGPAGTETVQLRAQNARGSATAALRVVVQQAPGFAERGPLVFGAGEFTSVVVRAAGHPAPGLGLEGDLPLGLTFTDNGDGTATVAGTPLAGAESVPVTLTAVNVVADAARRTVVRVVVRPETTAQATEATIQATRATRATQATQATQTAIQPAVPTRAGPRRAP